MTTFNIGLHGEATIKKINKLPKGVVKQEHTGDLIIAPSETVGNHHRIFCDDTEARLYEKNGVLYLEVDKPVGIVCADKHDKAILEPGYYEIGRQLEWDYINQMEQYVRD